MNIFLKLLLLMSCSNLLLPMLYLDRENITLELSDDKVAFVNASSDQNIKIYDQLTDQLLFILVGHQSPIVGLINLENNIMSISSDGAIRVWDVSSGEYCYSLLPSVHKLEKLPQYIEDRKVISVIEESSIGLWARDFYCNYRLYSKLIAHSDKIECLLVLEDETIVSSSHDGTIRIWDIKRGGESKVIYLGDGGYASSLVEVGHARIASCGSFDEAIKIWDLESCECEYILSGHTGFINCLMMLAAPIEFQGPILHNKLISASCDNTVRVWDLNNMQCERVLVGHEAPVSSLVNLAVSKDLESQNIGNGLFASGSWDGVVKIWNGINGECFGTIQINLGPIVDFLKIKESHA